MADLGHETLSAKQTSPVAAAATGESTIPSPADGSPTSEPTTDSRRQAQVQAQLDYEGRLVQKLFPAAVLSSIAGKQFGGKVSLPGFITYSDNIVAASSNSNDRIEAMLVEQLSWAHHQIGILHDKAAGAGKPEIAATYYAAIARLMAECRKNGLALQTLRNPAMPKQVTLVTGNQQVAVIDPEGNQATAEKTGDTELASNQARLNNVTRTRPFPADGKTNSRKTESVEVQGAHARGACEAQSNGVEESPVGILNGADHAGR